MTAGSRGPGRAAAFFYLPPGAWHCIMPSSRSYSLRLVWKTSSPVLVPRSCMVTAGCLLVCARAASLGSLCRHPLQQPLRGLLG